MRWGWWREGNKQAAWPSLSSPGSLNCYLSLGPALNTGGQALRAAHSLGRPARVPRRPASSLRAPVGRRALALSAGCGRAARGGGRAAGVRQRPGPGVRLGVRLRAGRSGVEPARGERGDWSVGRAGVDRAEGAQATDRRGQDGGVEVRGAGRVSPCTMAWPLSSPCLS